MRSLRARLILTCLAGMVLTAGLFAFALAMILYWQFDLLTYSGMKHNAQSAVAHMRFDARGVPQEIRLPDNVRWLYEQLPDDVEFRVVDRRGTPLPMPSVGPRVPRLLAGFHAAPTVAEATRLRIDTRNAEVVTVPIPRAGGAYYLQMAASDRALQFVGLSLAHPVPDYTVGMLVIALPVVGGLMLLVLLRVLRPLNALSAEAARIDPRNLSARLSTQAAPSELAPLIESFNLALVRLELGYREQQRFLGAAAHELKTPLALMRGQIEVEGMADRATLLGDIDVMTRQVQQLLHLAEASEPANYRVELIDVGTVLADASALLQRMADRRGVHIHLSALPDAAHGTYWVGDKSAMFTLVKNLLENAIQHSPVGGDVILRIEGRAALSVRDHGCGILPDHVPRLFERFWRGPGRIDGQAPGAGLGMSICKEIADAHNWRIEVEHAAPGTVFRLVSLPGLAPDCLRS